LHDGLELLLGADKEHALALEHDAPEQVLGLRDLAESLLEINDVDARALGENEAPHLRVPPASLVAEVDAGLEQVLESGLWPADIGFRSVLGLCVHRVHLRASTPRGTHARIPRCARSGGRAVTRAGDQ